MNAVTIADHPSAADRSRSIAPGKAPSPSDASVAVRSASTLGGSLLLTAMLGFVVQVLSQRHLGTSRVGVLGGAESLAVILLGLLSLGLETYTLKEVAVEPGEAKRFVPGVIAFRGGLTLVVVALTSLVLSFIGRGRLAIALFVLFGASRFLLQSNDMLAACLKAVGAVRSLPRVNVTSKVIWAAVILVGVFGGVGPVAVPVGWVVGESIKFVILARQVRQHLAIRWTLRNQHVARVLRASLPFTAGVIVAGWSGFFDTMLMSFQLPDHEVGLYRFAQQISGVTFLLGTVLPWVLLPLASRARARSHAEYINVIRSSLQFVVTLAIPASVLLALNADGIANLMGREWRPAIPALRILSLSLTTTYLVIIAVMFLQVEGRSWQVVRRSASALVSGMLVNIAFLRFGPRWFGDGGAGTFASLVVAGVELLTVVLLFSLLGRRVWGRRTLTAIGWTLLATCNIVVFDRLLVGRAPDLVRMIVDGALYPVFLVLWGAVTLRELRGVNEMRRSGAVG